MENFVEVGEREEKVVVGGLDVDDEVFEEAREQLPLVKAVTGDLNEDEVYVTPVVDLVAGSDVRGAAAAVFEEAVGVSVIGDVNANGDDNVRKEDVESVEGVKSGFASGGKTYAEVLVEKLDDAGYREDNLKDAAVVDNGGLTESLHMGNDVDNKSEIHAVEGNETSVIGELREQTSKTINSGVLENNNEDFHRENDVMDTADIDNGRLTESLHMGNAVDSKSEMGAIEGHTRDRDDNLGCELEDEDDEIDFTTGLRDLAIAEESLKTKGVNANLRECFGDGYAEKDVSASDDFENGEVKEVDSRSLPYNKDVTTVARELPAGEGSEIGADQTVLDGEVINNIEDIAEVLDHQDATDEHSQGSTAGKDREVSQPALVRELLSDHPPSMEIPDGSRSVAEVTQSNQASSEVLQHADVAEKVPSSSSDKSVNSPALPARPAGLGRASPLLEPSPRVVQQPRVNGSISQAQAQVVDEAANGENEENDETREKLQLIRVKFLRLARRLGQTPHNVVVAQVLYRLGLAEQLRGRTGGRVAAFSFDRASAMAEQLEAAGQEPPDFSCTIMVLGKTGVGKSSTINSIFDEVKFETDAFHSGTKKVQDVVGTVQGIKVRVIDTPGLFTSWSDQSQNEKILLSVKRFIKKNPPDIVLYLDRLDMQSREFGDMLLLRTITRVFGPSIWFNAIVVLTHAGSAPPDGPNGTASNYDTFVTQRSHVVQHAIRQAAGDMRLMNPVSLVENHSACRTNRAGQRVLPNGQVWKPHLLLLSFASKILAEANTLLKLQDGPPGQTFAARSRAPPLPYLLSSMLQSRPHLRLPEEQMGGDDSLDDDLEDSSGSDNDSEYDELPPFKPLTKAQLSSLSKAQKKAYYDELEYREKLLMKKQLKEEKLRRKIMKKMAAAAKEIPKEYSENVEEENGAAASVPVPMPDLALPASFDSDNPTHRYRYLDSSNPWLVRPVLETQGWDHDVGYEGINVERSFVVKEKVPLSFSGQVTKDKKDANVQMEVAGTLKHGEGKATSVGLDLQTVGKDIAYTLRSESTFCNFLRNKATAGMSFTLLGDALSAGMKLEDKLIANKRFRMVLTGGAMTNRGDIAYGGSLEATLRDKDHPLGRSLSTLGLSVMDWHGDLAIGCNIQSQIPIGRHSNLIARANLNNKGSGQVSIRLNSAEQLQIALIALLPLLRKALSFSQESFQD